MSKKKKKHSRNKSGKPGGSTVFQHSVLQNIRRHARSSMNMEICGVLIGRQSDSGTYVTGAVPGVGAAQGGGHVTFTQQTWVGIHEEKDRLYPGQAIVGWYHSHPGFGVFLSDHDIFIHKNFFQAPGSLAWVFDPHSDEEGCFGWNGGEVRRLDRIEVVTSVPSGTSPTRNKEHAQGSTLANISGNIPQRLRKMTPVILLILFAVILALIARSSRVRQPLQRIQLWFTEERPSPAPKMTPVVVPSTQRNKDAVKTDRGGNDLDDVIPKRGEKDVEPNGERNE